MELGPLAVGTVCRDGRVTSDFLLVASTATINLQLGGIDLQVKSAIRFTLSLPLTQVTGQATSRSYCGLSLIHADAHFDEWRAWIDYPSRSHLHDSTQTETGRDNV